MRDSVVFYRSFYEALKDLPPEQFKESVKAIMEYGLNGKEPETTGIEKTIFLLTKPQIDANNKRYQNGTKGGRKATASEPNQNQTVTKPEPKSNQTETKTEPKEKEKVKVKEKDIYSAREEEPLQLFEDFWQAYPKRVSRMLTEQAYVQLLSSTPSLREEQVVAAAKNYAEACKILRTQDRYISLPHNFLEKSVWVDYLPENYKRPQAQKWEKKTGTGFSNFEQRDYDFGELEKQLLESQEISQEV